MTTERWSIVATCKGCPAKWNGATLRSHCSACHTTFGSSFSFDLHRWAIGRGHGCHKPEDCGLTLVDDTWYSTCVGDRKQWK